MSKKVWMTAAGLTAFVLLQFAVTCRFGFVPYDDAIHITENRLFAVQESSGFLRAWIMPIQKLFIPLSYSVWAGLARIAQQGISGDGYWIYDATWFHAANVMLHLWNTLWVAAILRLWIQREFAVGAAAAFFALHPLQIEAVAWVSGLRDLLSASLALPSLWCVVSALRYGDDRRKYLGIGTILYVMALLAKPNAVALPVITGVLLVYFGRSNWRWWLLVGGWAALALPVVVITKLAQTTGDLVSYPWWQRPWVAMDAVSFYLSKLILPIRLSIDYGATPTVVLQRVSSLFALGVASLFAVLIAVGWKNLWSLGLAIFVAALVPVLGIFSFEFQFHSTVADRYVYLGMLGVALCLADLLAKRRKLVDGLAVVVVSILVGLGWSRVRLWGDAKRLFEQTLVTNPGSLMAWQALGADSMNHRRWSDALEAYRSVLYLRPNFAEAEYNLAVAFEHLERHEQALEHFSKVAWSKQSTYSSLIGVARSAKRLQRWDLASDALRRAELTFPGRVESLWIGAEILVANQDYAGAEEKFRLALAKRPGAYDLRTIYADFLADHGDKSVAIAEYRRVIDSQPQAVAARINLGGLLASLGQFEEAERELREGVMLAPDLAAARVNLATLLETTGRQRAAMSEFQAALKLDPTREDARLGLERLVRQGVHEGLQP